MPGIPETRTLYEILPAKSAENCVTLRERCHEESVKQMPTSVPFDHEQMAAAMALAPDEAGHDPGNPATEAADWDGAVVSRSLPDLRRQLAKRSRGPQKAPVKVPTTIRFDADLLDALKRTGNGWQTRVNDALREWAEAQELLDRASGKR